MMPVIKISRPIITSIMPPNMEALSDSFVPNFLPTAIPTRQIAKVTTPMIKQDKRAGKRS